METAQYSVDEVQILRPKSGRKPLQPRNIIQANPIVHDLAKTSKAKKEWIEISVIGCDGQSNKENNPVCTATLTLNPTTTPTTTKLESLDSSLAEELSAIRKKLERQREDRERTERMLKERDSVLEMKMKELELRGETQRELEIELDRLYRLKQLHSQSMEFSPLRSLRDKEREKKVHEEPSEELDDGDREESVGDNASQELNTSASSETITDK
ncbi:hypothetical protein FNV43_RR08609 [Rhamnella rubrinervis]|uniref:Uncharacterized protein n=1 Tax=Rhamnella rubrinervis TaxID=2594499 RepID=A0A8K0H8J0_9ROSA|nr:hypothetical protein FNV43_RR08609 [Rhamnella rubrinervis]